VIALVFMKLGTVAEVKDQPGDLPKAQRARIERPHYPQPSGNEPTTEISTFLIGDWLFGVESSNVVCSINDQQATPLVCANPGFVGVFSYAGQTVGIVSLREVLGMPARAYNPATDGILLVKVRPAQRGQAEERMLGIVIDRVMDSPEIPNKSIARYDSELAGKSVLTKAVVHPDNGDERSAMLSILDVEALEERMLSAIGAVSGEKLKLLARDAGEKALTEPETEPVLD
jgi:chemotaxis signal transduction protein